MVVRAFGAAQVTEPDDLDRSESADALRLRWMLAGNGYFLEEAGLCGHGVGDEDKARRAIDAEMTGAFCDAPVAHDAHGSIIMDPATAERAASKGWLMAFADSKRGYWSSTPPTGWNKWLWFRDSQDRTFVQAVWADEATFAYFKAGDPKDYDPKDFGGEWFSEPIAEPPA